MIQIRENVFETNSSSTHSIAVPIKNYDDYNGLKLSFNFGKYGWKQSSVNPANYFYTAISYIVDSKEDFEKYKNKLNEICKNHGIEAKFEEPKFEEYDGKYYLSYEQGYIDHGCELVDFVKELFNNEDRLLSFLFHGHVFTGNDNGDESCYFINRHKKFIDDYNWRTGEVFKVENPYYMEGFEKDYDWYFKGN